MKLGIVSDVHCNPRALGEALRLMRDADRFLCLGDSIYEYRFCDETVDLLRRHDVLTIRGNHEEVYFGSHGARARAHRPPDPGLAAWLDGQPHTRMIELDGCRIQMVHATPWPPYREYVLPTSDTFPQLAESGADIVLYGHTHHAVARRVGDALIVNPGSAGEARGVGENAFVSCAMLDTASREVEFLRFADPSKA